MPVILALTLGLVVLICGYSLGLGSLVSAVCAVTILLIGVAVHTFGPSGGDQDEPPADRGRAIN